MAPLYAATIAPIPSRVPQRLCNEAFGGALRIPTRMRKAGGPRSCYKNNGAPKAAFETKKAAERAIPRTTSGLRPYRCEKHGWHLGHS